MNFIKKYINNLIDERIKNLENRIFQENKEEKIDDLFPTPQWYPFFWDTKPKTLEEEITDNGEKIDLLANFLKVEFEISPKKEEMLVVRKLKKYKKG